MKKKPVYTSRIFCELKVADDVLMGDVKWRFSGDDCESCGHQGLPVLLSAVHLRESSRAGLQTGNSQGNLQNFLQALLPKM